MLSSLLLVKIVTLGVMSLLFLILGFEEGLNFLVFPSFERA